MKTLTKYSTTELKEIKRALEKFFYTAGTNIALYNSSRQPEYKKFREACERAIIKQVNTFATPENVGAVMDRIPPTLKKIDDTIIETIVTAILSSFTEALKGGSKIVVTYLLWAGNRGGQSAMDKAGIDVKFNLFNPEVVDKLRDRANFLVNTLDETTKEWIARTIADGTEKALSRYEIARLLKENVKDMSALRARKIVETETANAMGIVELEAMKRNGSTTKRWITSRDEKVCPICVGNEKQGAIPISQPFASGTMHEPAHIFCRCYLEGSIPPTLTFDSVWTGN